MLLYLTVRLIVNRGQDLPLAFIVPNKNGRFLRRDRPLANIYVINQKVLSIIVILWLP